MPEDLVIDTNTCRYSYRYRDRDIEILHVDIVIDINGDIETLHIDIVIDIINLSYIVVVMM